MSRINIKKTVIISIICLLALWIIYPFTYPILFASLLAIMLYPLQKKLEIHIGKHRSSLIIVLSILLCVFIPVLILASYAITEAISYIQNTESLSQAVSQINAHIAKIPYIGDLITSNIDKILESLKQNKKEVLSSLGQLLSKIGYIGSASTSIAIDFFMTLLLLYQFLVSSKSINKFFQKIIFNDFSDSDQFVSTAIITIRRVSLALSFTAILTIIIMGTTFSLVDLPAPILLSCIVAIASMIPFMVGVAYALIAIIVFLSYGVSKAIIVLVVGIALNLFTDNYMQPKIINDHVKLSFVASLIGIMGGMQAFGIIGVFLGPVIFNITFLGIEKVMNNKS